MAPPHTYLHSSTANPSPSRAHTHMRMCIGSPTGAQYQCVCLHAQDCTERRCVGMQPGRQPGYASSLQVLSLLLDTGGRASCSQLDRRLRVRMGQTQAHLVRDVVCSGARPLAACVPWGQSSTDICPMSHEALNRQSSTDNPQQTYAPCPVKPSLSCSRPVVPIHLLCLARRSCGPCPCA